MRYTLRQLEVFLATAHFENVSRAADHLSMSQSAASGALKELESQFEIKLFERAGKRLRLNELGRQLWPRAEALLGQARDLEAGLLAHQELGQLNVGATLPIGQLPGGEYYGPFYGRNARRPGDTGGSQPPRHRRAGVGVRVG